MLAGISWFCKQTHVDELLKSTLTVPDPNELSNGLKTAVNNVYSVDIPTAKQCSFYDEILSDMEIFTYW